MHTCIPNLWRRQGVNACMHAQFTSGSHKGPWPCALGLRPPPKELKVKAWSPPEEAHASSLSLSLSLSSFSKWAAHTLSLTPSTCGLSIVKRGQSHLPLSLMHDSAFPYLFLQGNQEKGENFHLSILWLVHFTYMRWQTLCVSYTLLTRGPPSLGLFFWMVEECPISLICLLNFILAYALYPPTI